MRAERFSTEARLLGSTRADGAEATALDTGNTFKYLTGVGWTQYVPVNGYVGEPLVVAQDRGRSSFDIQDRLIPTGGTPGQLVAVNGTGATATVNRDDGTGALLPLDFTDGAEHTIYTLSLAGGSLGLNGFLRVRCGCLVVTNAARTATLKIKQGSTALISGSSASLSSSANPYGLLFDFEFKNANTATSTRTYGNCLSTLNGVFHSIQGGAPGTTSFDSTADATLDFTITASGAVTGTAEVDFIHVEYGYVG